MSAKWNMPWCVAEGLSDTCTERRVFYRLISGLHTSIAVHIAKHYLLDEVTEEVSSSDALSDFG
jgi:hypothetical protein